MRELNVLEQHAVSGGYAANGDIVVVTAPGLSGDALETFQTMTFVWAQQFQGENDEIGDDPYVVPVFQKTLTGEVSVELFEKLGLTVGIDSDGDIHLGANAETGWTAAQLGEIFDLLDTVSFSGNVSPSGESIITFTINGNVFGAQAALTWADGNVGWEVGGAVGADQLGATVGLEVDINISAAIEAVQQNAVDANSTLGFLVAAQLGYTATYVGIPVADPSAGPTWEEIILNWLNSLNSPLSWRIPGGGFN